MSKSNLSRASALVVTALSLIVAATAITFTAGMLALASPAQAREIQWCAKIHGRGTSCMYHTEEQCRASISGRGGTCVRRRT
ncbi:DUF3551 domain-containing protein [Bradyrhizobium guangzhouense]|uniref:DUF3551 domain-containing protein n=2 Tax=Bradyrhizobium guangzhouense TaxID=1325095 RepID=A0ABY0DXB2_9BRAD|nr:DUF3551 domain-containing protein [Bradyrhizobium guangzhouense]